MAFKFAVVSRDGDVFDTFESARPDWSVGDPVYLADNRQFRVTATIRSSPCRCRYASAPAILSEFVDQAVYGVLEV